MSYTSKFDKGITRTTANRHITNIRPLILFLPSNRIRLHIIFLAINLLKVIYYNYALNYSHITLM